MAQRSSKDEKARLKREYKERIESQEAFDKVHANNLARAQGLKFKLSVVPLFLASVAVVLFSLWLIIPSGSQRVPQSSTAVDSDNSDSPSPLQVYDYCENLWNTALAAGNPISLDFNNPVFDSAANSFGISTDEVRLLYFDETSSRSGDPNHLRE